MGAVPSHADYSGLAETALNAITDGVLIIDETGVIKFANPAAARMTGYGDPSNLVGLSYQLVMKLETLDGAVVDSAQSKLAQAIMANQAVTLREYVLVAMQGQHKDAIALTLTPTGGPHADKIITFRDITKLERNGMFVYESVPGTAVEGFRADDTGVSFTVEGDRDAQITLELSDGAAYDVMIGGADAGVMSAGTSGKLTLSVELSEGTPVPVEIRKR